MLWALTRGEAGLAYNVADPSGAIMLRDLAGKIARAGGGDVVFELPDAVERAGYSTATKALMDGTRLRALGWKPMYTFDEGIARTVELLKS